MTTAIRSTQETAWQVDPAHTDVEFAVRHMMVANVKGRFGNVSGTVELNERNPRAPKVEVSIPVATIDTRSEQRDAHLRSGDFFAADAYPTIEFRGGRVIGDPASDRFELEGEITIRGVTKTITLDVTTEGRGRDPWGNERIGYSATAKLDRKD